MSWEVFEMNDEFRSKAIKAGYGDYVEDVPNGTLMCLDDGGEDYPCFQVEFMEVGVGGVTEEIWDHIMDQVEHLMLASK